MTSFRSDNRSRSFAPPLVGRTEPPDQIVHLVSESLHGHALLSRIFGFGIEVVSFRSATEYLNHQRKDESSCIVLDLELAEMAGLELQRCVSKKANTPIIVIGDRSDVAACVGAMKAGAIDCVTKPLDSPSLMVALQAAFAQDRKLRQRKAEQMKLKQRFGRLTPREREVLPLVIGGLLNKQAVGVLGISEVTLQIHSSQVMRKMGAQSLADLVRMAVKLHVPYWREPLTIHEQPQADTAHRVRRRAPSFDFYQAR